jgi:glucose uptake protein GlcU
MKVVCRFVIALLVAFASYSVFVAVRAVFFGDGAGPVFWTAVGMIVVAAAAATGWRYGSAPVARTPDW